MTVYKKTVELLHAVSWCPMRHVGPKKKKKMKKNEKKHFYRSFQTTKWFPERNSYNSKRAYRLLTVDRTDRFVGRVGVVV